MANLSEKDNAIRELDSLRPRTLGGGINTANLEQIAAQNQGTVRTDPIVRSFSEAEWQKKARRQMWITLAGVAGLFTVGVLLIKAKVIKL